MAEDDSFVVSNKKESKQTRNNPFDSTDSESSLYDDGSNALTKDISDILEYFNTGTLSDLTVITGLSETKAERIIKNRPFKSPKELLSSKLCNDNVLESCQEIINIKKGLSSLLKKCEMISMKFTNRIQKEKEAEKELEQPASLAEGMVLKDYQLIGINWLRMVHEEGLNGILADEMGLGKTIQTIAFLSYLYDSGLKGPHIIIVPTSTLNNWVREFKKWCPHMELAVYHGNLEERREMRCEIASNRNINILLTTYNISVSNKDDRLFIKKMDFQYGIFDEAHMLKNMLSQRYQYLCNFKIKRKLLLTGTPLQNNLIELISLLSFVMPSMFSDANNGLKKIFQMSQSKANQKSLFCDEKILQIKEMLGPFCLRRLKNQVLTQLPKKTVEEILLPMVDEQARIYNDFKETSRSRKENKALQIVMELRKMSCHPLLVRSKYTDEVLRKMSHDMLLDEEHITANEQLIFEDFSVLNDFEIHSHCLFYPHAIGKYKLDNEMLVQSNKIKFLDENLPVMIANGDKVLIFSQFVITLDIIAEFLKYRNLEFARLDGSTVMSDRQDFIDDFNDKQELSIFLLSTRAGGLGINLTSANVVILHDIDYNPYNDRQAEDRSHRMGQLRDVRVIKLISENSIDECILSVAKEKLKLEQLTLNGDGEEEAGEGPGGDPKDIDYTALMQMALEMKK